MRTHAHMTTQAGFGLLVLVALSALASPASVGHNNYNHHSHNRQHLLASGSRIAFHQQQELPLNATESSDARRELHYGARVALTILAGAIMLVASATYLDYHIKARRASAGTSCSVSEHLDAQDAKEQQATVRDQRSPSLSSHSSSTLFCSASSVASASVPILGRGHFKRNLRLSLTKARGEAAQPTSTTELECRQKTQPIWRIGAEHHANPRRDHLTTSNLMPDRDSRRNNLLSWQFARQLFLAFSLRNSASLIFQRQQQDRPQSIDSLHGLRFLSMIWLIAMHSYSFAFRWMFFAKSPSLDDIYKTAASQLLANGTFACDSFLFAGGFLLPYLAFPSNNRASRRQSEPNSACPSPDPAHRTEDDECDSRPPTASSGEPLETKQVARARQQPPSSQTKVASEQATGKPSCADEPPAWSEQRNTNEFTLARVLGNLLHRYIRMMPLMMAIIGLSATLLRYLGEGPAWDDSTIMFDKWCRKNWWINALFMHNFLNRENMCLSHSWYSAVDIQLFLLGQVILFVLFRSRKLGLLLLALFLFGAQLITGTLTLLHHLPAVPQLASFSEQSMNQYYGEIYIKPYCRASPYLVGILLAYLMRTTSLGAIKLRRWQVAAGWTASISLLLSILMAMQPAMNGRPQSDLESALYSALSRPLWACATGWMIFACMTNNGGVFATILSARLFIPLSKLTYPAFLIHPIVMAIFYGSRQSSFEFSHYLMLYLILGNIVITYASAFVLSALFELPLLSSERAIKRALR